MSAAWATLQLFHGFCYSALIAGWFNNNWHPCFRHFSRPKSQLLRNQQISLWKSADLGVPTLSLHHVSAQETQQVRQHKRAGVIVKTKNRKQHVVTSPLASVGTRMRLNGWWFILTSSLLYWDPMLPLIIRLFTQSRRGYWAEEMIRVRGWDRWEAFGLMRRAQRDLRSMWSVWGDSARTVLVHLCELLPSPKGSLRALILRSNNSAAQ